jgi:hypothetical protein
MHPHNLAGQAVTAMADQGCHRMSWLIQSTTKAAAAVRRCSGACTYHDAPTSNTMVTSLSNKTVDEAVQPPFKVHHQ